MARPAVQADELVFTAPPTTSEDRAATITAIALAESGGRTEVNVDPVDGLAVSRAVKGGEFDCTELVQWASGQHTNPPVAHVAISLGDDRTVEILVLGPPIDELFL